MLNPPLCSFLELSPLFAGKVLLSEHSIHRDKLLILMLEAFLFCVNDKKLQRTVKFSDASSQVSLSYLIPCTGDNYSVFLLFIGPNTTHL